MAFVVEDGTIVTGATSYAAVADADAYFLDRGNTVWAAAIAADKEAALIRATQAVDNYGNGRFVGYQSTATQALLWPRTDAYNMDDYALTGVPNAVKVATYEGAVTELATPGALTPSLSRGGMIKSERVEGAIEVVYQDGAPSSTVYTSFTRALAPVIKGYGSSLMPVYRV